MFTYQTYLFHDFRSVQVSQLQSSLSPCRFRAAAPPPVAFQLQQPRESCNTGKALPQQSRLFVVKRRCDTRELRSSVILSAATQYTHHCLSDTTAVIQSRLLCVVPVCRCRWTQGGAVVINGWTQKRRKCGGLLSLV